MILFARHGETDDNAPPTRVMGHRDPPLNARGREQARALAQEVAGEGLAALWTSPLRRARETAGIVGEVVGLQPRVDDRLAESRRGSWEGRLLSEIERDEPEAWEAWRLGGADFRFPDGESLGEHQERVLEALADVALGPQPALVISHGGTIRAAVASRHPGNLDGYHEFDVPNATLIRLES